MDKKEKRLTLSIPWAKILDLSIIITKGKGSGEDKVENKDLLLIIDLWLLSQEPKDQKKKIQLDQQNMYYLY